MAYGDVYADVGDLEERLDTTDDGTFTQRLAVASRAVEAFTERQFNRDTADPPTATARSFRAVSTWRLAVDDFHTTTDLAVTVDGTEWDVDAVAPWPPDGIVDGQPGWPFYELRVVGSAPLPWRLPYGHRRGTITVTAHWGWAAVPAAIKEATLDVAVANTGDLGGVYPKSQETIMDWSASYAVPRAAAFHQVPAEVRKAFPYRRRRWGVG